MRAKTFSIVTCALALTACALKDLPPHEDIVQAGSPNLKLPANWTAAGAGPGAFAADNWLASWNDAGLDALVTEALTYNTDLRAAASRVDLAAAYLQAAGSPMWPQVNLVARGGGKMGGDATGLQGVGVFASWELDVWGRVRSEKAASEMQYESAQLDADYARQSIAALVAKGWVLAIEARLAKARSEEMLRTAESSPPSPATGSAWAWVTNTMSPWPRPTSTPSRHSSQP